MDIHKNARLTPHSRAELVRRVLDDRQPAAAILDHRALLEGRGGTRLDDESLRTSHTMSCPDLIRASMNVRSAGFVVEGNAPPRAGISTPRFVVGGFSWMPGSSPGMTAGGSAGAVPLVTANQPILIEPAIKQRGAGLTATVMPGLDPGIHDAAAMRAVMPGHDRPGSDDIHGCPDQVRA